mmetsp:Transcript_2134/g.7386  ORF Transcript_2134/g.7386 Transcript_2134/m.7386 type:complete len:213 (-) Transcript_2134:2510-3148(-)
MPTCAATARATLQLSPETIDVVTPRLVSAAIASFASGRIGSLTHTNPTGGFSFSDLPPRCKDSLPPAVPVFATCTTTTVWPFSSSLLIISSNDPLTTTPLSCMNRTLPSVTKQPLRKLAATPMPARASKESVASKSIRLDLVLLVPLFSSPHPFRAATTMALPTGCSLETSADAANWRMSSWEKTPPTPSRVTMFVTAGFPTVMVPVLSKMI